MSISCISHVAICRNGNNGPGDSAGRCSFLCPVCLRKVWLALSFTPSGPTNSVLSRYQVSCRCASIVTLELMRHCNFFKTMTRMKNWHMTTLEVHVLTVNIDRTDSNSKLWIPNEAILQLMRALEVKFKDMEVLDEMPELLGDIDWLEILGHRGLCWVGKDFATFCWLMWVCVRGNGWQAWAELRKLELPDDLELCILT